MIIIKNKKTSIEELINIYTDIRFSYGDLLNIINKENYPDRDTRVDSLKLIIEPVQSIIILLYLIKEHFGEISIWELQKFDNQEQKNEFLNNRLLFIINELRENLFINIFIRFENFIKIISKSLNINGEKINMLSKNLIDELNLSQEYKDLINLITYTRNTIHTEGFHTRPNITINYKGNDYEFKENEPLLFYNEDTLKLILLEIKSLIEDILDSLKVKSQTYIPHIYQNIIHDYE